MSSDIAIKVTGISKTFKLYERAKHRLFESLHPLRKKYHKEFHALSPMSFEIKKGESVGIIGKNGAGKSTMLKILTGVLTPSTGTVQVNGRIAALLELGSGFNPELSGVDNIYFQGAILGFTRDEVHAKVAQIIEFADIGDFVYQPVKTYSSGMFARLAFSIAINVVPDILIVDEALAVGDIFFQSRCYAKIREFLTGDKVVIFVAHDYETIRTLTQRALLLDHGKIIADGTSKDVTFQYRAMEHETSGIADVNEKSGVRLREFGDYDCVISRIVTMNNQGEKTTVFYPGAVITVRMECEAKKEVSNLCVGFRLRNKEGVKVYSGGTLNVDISRGSHDLLSRTFQPGEQFMVDFKIDCKLGANLYEIQSYIVEEKIPYYAAQRIIYWRDEAIFFEVKHNKDGVFFGGVYDLDPQYQISVEKPSSV